MIDKTFFVYILASRSRVLYTGVTNNLGFRVYQHKQRAHKSFTQQYHVTRLIYYEMFGDVRDAIAREKQIKSWRRSKKIALIEAKNPKWRDLSEGWSI
jgi:putative endonuclease